METAGLEVQHISLVDKEFIREVIAYCLKKKKIFFFSSYIHADLKSSNFRKNPLREILQFVSFCGRIEPLFSKGEKQKTTHDFLWLQIHNH